MKSWIKFGLFAVSFLILALISGFLSQKDMVPKNEIVQKKASIPELRITLEGVGLDEIKENNKEIKYFGNMMVLGDLAFEDVEIKGRGNATWNQPKKPYQIKLPQKTDLLGLDKRRKWILIAGYWDDTSLRTDTAFYIERMVGEKYAYDGRFVELYIDDEYEGLYYLTRGIEIGKNAVDLRDPLGALVELDNVYGRAETPFYITGNGECLMAKDVVDKDNVESAMESFVESFNELEAAVRERNYAKITEVADVKSFAQYYLVSEITANPDAYFTSQYFYKDGLDDKIHAGPAWDFDISLNNVRVRGETDTDLNMTKVVPVEYFESADEQYGQWSRLFARLIRFSEFEREVKKVFRGRMAGRKVLLLEHIIGQAAKIYDAAMRDGERWEKDEYVVNVRKMLAWINKRFDYLEREYGTERYQNYPAHDINIVEI